MQESVATKTRGVRVDTVFSPDHAAIITRDALGFVAELCYRHRPQWHALLEQRERTSEQRDRGEQLAFREDTRWIREADWQVGETPPDLLKRVVEITGPVERKMIINALNSGADVFMADFEDSASPTFQNMLDGQANLRDAARGEIEYDDPNSKKHYELGEHPAVLMVRPRGLHLPETHATVDGSPVPGSLFDFGLYLFHNAHELLRRGSGPYFYLPKLECAEEAAWWNDVFCSAEDLLDLPRGTIKATVLIETVPAAFQMDEILHALREHIVGLNCGRWDYIFSFIKVHRFDPAAILPDRAEVTMSQPFMRAYTRLLVKTCHRRGAHAMGGMAAQIPLKGDPDKAAEALAKVRDDKIREVVDGHDGTWVAHPGLVQVARDAFESRMSGDHQRHVSRDDVSVTADDLLAIPTGPRTAAGLHHNIKVGIQYLDSWLQGKGCVPLYGLMEDAATAEISRAQIGQWLQHGAVLDDGRVVTLDLVRASVARAMTELREEHTAKPDSRIEEARELFQALFEAVPMKDFLTTEALPLLESDPT